MSTQKDEKSQFLTKLSHELRAPMNSIIGFSELALDEANPPGTKNYLNQILHNAKWLLQKIDGMLDTPCTEACDEQARAACGGEDERNHKVRLKSEFVRDNQTTFNAISKAIYADNIALAHKLAHNLKNSAGHIGKLALRKAAADVEGALKGGQGLPRGPLINTLRIELSAVLDELAHYLGEKADKYKTEASLKSHGTSKELRLAERLESLLMSGCTECLEHIDSLSMIPGSEKLVRQIENFDFAQAVESLGELKKEMELEKELELEMEMEMEMELDVIK